MKITQEIDLLNFDFWSGAIYTVKVLTEEQLDTIQTILEDCYPDGLDVTILNDIFWFDRDMLADWLGFDDFEQLEKSNERERGK